MSLLNLASDILKGLKDFSFENQESLSGVYSYELELESTFDLKTLSLYTDIYPQCFLATKAGNRSDLALGSAKSFRRLDESETLDLYLEDEKVILFGGKRFDPLKNI